MCNENIHSRYFNSFCLAGIIVLALITISDAAPERAKTTRKPGDEIFILSRPEVIPARDLARKRFRPVVPKRTVLPTRRQEMQLYTGIADSGVPEYVSMLFPKTPVLSIGDPQIPMTGPRPGDYFPPRYIPPASLREEMLDFEDLDNGKFRALAARTGQYERDIKGFVYIPSVWGQQLRIPDQSKRAVIHLVEAVNRFTDIEAKTDRHLLLDYQRLSKTPFLYITTDQAFELTASERQNLGAYLRNGGFVFADNGTPEYENGAAEASLRHMFREALGSNARFAPIPASHPLYHCYFDFDGPPQSSEKMMQTFDTSGYPGYYYQTMRMPKPVFSLEGIWLDGRLVAIYSDKGYATKWKDLANNIPQLKFGVNLVVYALTREDGMTQRMMDRFADIQ